jgi:hypothetical protein
VEIILNITHDGLLIKFRNDKINLKSTAQCFRNALLVLKPINPHIALSSITCIVGNERCVGIGRLEHDGTHHHVFLVRKDVTVIDHTWKLHQLVFAVVEERINAFGCIV